MSEPTKRKFPETKNAELRSLYAARETLEAHAEKRKVDMQTFAADTKTAHQSTLLREASRLREVNTRIEQLEKAEQKASAGK
jgi:phosphoribosylamine-glycine ligase